MEEEAGRDDADPGRHGPSVFHLDRPSGAQIGDHNKQFNINIGASLVGAGAPAQWQDLQQTLTSGETDDLTDLFDEMAIHTDLHEIYGAATGGRFPPPPEFDLARCVEFLRALHPQFLFAFVERLAGTVTDVSLRQRIHTWVDVVAPAYLEPAGLDSLVRLRQGVARQRGRHTARQWLSLRIEPDVLSDDMVHLSAWTGVDSGALIPASVAELQLQWHAVPAALAALIDEHCPRDTRARDRSVIDVSLPPRLLNAPVDMWTVSDGGRPSPIGALYPVVVRPTPALPAPPREHWERVLVATAYDASAIHWASDRGSASAQRSPLCCAIVDPDLACDPVSALQTVRATGALVGIWHRDTDRSRRRERLAGLLQGRGLAGLPDVVRAQRAAAAAPSASRRHPGRDLVLLWDDPGRLLGPWYRLNPPSRRRHDL